MVYTIIGAVIALAAIALAAPAVSALWRDRVERRDRAYAEALLEGKAATGGKVPEPARRLSSRMTARKRERKFDEQLADALPMISKSMQAGHTFEQAAELVSRFMDEPLRGQFAQLAAERRVGISLEQAMNNLASRTKSRDARMLAAAVSVQAEAGGAITETIDSIGAAMRRRAKTRRHISSLTASYRMSSKIIFLIPVVLFAILTIMSPENTALLFTHPIGRAALVVAVGLDVAGMLLIRRLYQLKIY